MHYLILFSLLNTMHLTGCGGIFRDRPTGKFTSPNYPNGYPLDVECVWKIIAPWEKSIEITISELHVEDSHLCGNDFIAVSSIWVWYIYTVYNIFVIGFMSHKIKGKSRVKLFPKNTIFVIDPQFWFCCLKCLYL